MRTACRAHRCLALRAPTAPPESGTGEDCSCLGVAASSGLALGQGAGRDRVSKDHPVGLSALAALSPGLCPKWSGLLGHPAPRFAGQVACQILLGKFPAKEGLAGGAAGGAGGGCEAWHAAAAQLRSRPGCPLPAERPQLRRGGGRDAPLGPQYFPPLSSLFHS